MTARRLGVGVVIVAVGLFVGYGTALLASREVRYLSRAGLEEIRILQGRRPLDDLIADPAVDDTTRALLALVRDVRGYAVRLGFEAGKTYTSYTDVGRDTLLLVLSAAPKDCLCAHTWKYPIVGRIPYKGFFDPRMADREAGRLERRGYDIYLRPAGAFSTLGWFEDPLLSTAMSRDSVELAATVFHEIAHNTLYLKSATSFNESFAQYAGYRAAEAFFRDRGDEPLARRAADRWADEQRLGRFYGDFAERLEAFYALGPAGPALDSGRAELARWARNELEGLEPQLVTYRLGPVAERPVNNARVLASRFYRTHLDWFEAWHGRHGGALRDAVAALDRLLEGAEGEAGFARLGEALQAGS